MDGGGGYVDTRDELERAKAGDSLSSEAGADGVTESASPEYERPERGSSWIMMSIVAIPVVGLVGYLLLSSSTQTNSPFVYSQQVNEVMADPAAFADRTLRVEGDLQSGSIRFREDPCEWRFTLEKDGHQMPVEFPQCVVPDTFRDGMGISVVVEGRLREDGTFAATQVIPRCPSRYEMEERRQNGEEMPHAPPRS